MQKFSLTSVIISTWSVLAFAVYVGGQTEEARCLQFTWLGPKYTNKTNFKDATCLDATQLSRGVPCQRPLVVSDDGTWPDVEHIRTQYPNVSCVLAPNEICARFTYSFNGIVDNSTYFCTRAVDTLGNAITGGCHEQVNGSYSTKVCFCRTAPGGEPCNNSIMPSINYVTIILIAIALILQFVKYS